MKASILIVDDEPEMRVSCRRILEAAGYSVDATEDPREALALLDDSVDLLLADLRLPGMSGIELIEAAKERLPALTAIIITGYATVQTAVEAVKRGAFDYIPKPFTAEQLTALVEKALEHGSKREELEQLRAQAGRETGLVGASAAISNVISTIEMIAPADASILITGESGTGKELAAHHIHSRSRRAGGPFVAIDCAALPENLLESELFGHEKGAFTGAERVKAGLMEQADGGTLLLDEIGELSVSLQGKLLRSLQEREIRRVGANRTIPVDVRVVALTNRDLRREIAAGAFREDLFFRLNVVEIEMPPLRDREGDIGLLANLFLARYTEKYHRDVREFSARARAALEGHPFPGNVRELANMIERAVLLAAGPRIRLADLPPPLNVSRDSALSLQRVREKGAESIEKPYLLELLARHRGNVSAAAAEAKVTRKVIYRLARMFEISVDEFR